MKTNLSLGQIERDAYRAGAFTYHINLDERGSFFADVRGPDGETVFDVRGGDELSEDDSSIVEDGFMRHFRDVVGLRDYLVTLGIIGRTGTLTLDR